MGSPGAGIVVGLRIDVDTFRGTRDGVPALLDILSAHGCFGSFFFSVGPDNMGRHLWRLINPGFLIKMLRSNAVNLYGWDILRRGILWPGTEIGSALQHIFRKTAEAGHEVGLHAWDHHAWQSRLHRMTNAEARQHLEAGFLAMKKILGTMPDCSASAGWICNEATLRIKEEYGQRYNSDCRGTSIFRPEVGGKLLTPQIPVTLPTYDELVGRYGITDSSYNEFLLGKLRPDELNVLTIHAEVEGIAKKDLFREFLALADERNVRFVPLGRLLPLLNDIPCGRIGSGAIEGRGGSFCVQVAA